MTPAELLEAYCNSRKINELKDVLCQSNGSIHLSGIAGSGDAFVISAIFKHLNSLQLVISPNKEEAIRNFSDLEQINKTGNVLFLPSKTINTKANDEISSVDTLCRTETISRLSSNDTKIVVTFPAALLERYPSQIEFNKTEYRIKQGEIINRQDLIQCMIEMDYAVTDYVAGPGQFAVRGGIVDVFSFSSEYPVRIEFFDNTVESIRMFNPATQLSIHQLSYTSVSPDVDSMNSSSSFFNLIPADSTIWIYDLKGFREIMDEHNQCANDVDTRDQITIDDFNKIQGFRIIETSSSPLLSTDHVITLSQSPQPSFNKNFNLLNKILKKNAEIGITSIIAAANQKQLDRLRNIYEDRGENAIFNTLPLGISEGFTDLDTGIACFTDHQIFMRNHMSLLKSGYKKARQDIVLNELSQLQKGDYVTHIDHGIGIFDGLEKIDNNGKEKEALRILYKDNDILYVSIHSLHRISKYTGKEGGSPKINKLGTKAWSKLKNKTKNRVKELAFDLVKLYARRKNTIGFSFSPDTYLQNELDASFIYEDTKDQLSATIATKKDMEASHPMDRLICGDVGFGKTEIAIRAAFKCVADSKQVVVLCPTTILTLQHYQTFTQRLADFPCRVDYINRFVPAQKQKEVLADLHAGKTDIIIGTHRLLSNDVHFKDLGLLILDEEQKFGVAAKEKLKKIRSNVDILTLTATPIPRTLQFSLMGARDLSIINTAPPNRLSVITVLSTFNDSIIRTAVLSEINRGGQVFLLHNKIHNIEGQAEMIRKLCPDVRVETAHGRMDSIRLEKTMIDFFNGETDVLVCTSIVESGLDVPSANTIIINDAHHFGLSDLHQLRGRVGRSNVQAYCYLFCPPLSTLPVNTVKRLRAIEQFSDLGSGFNIALRDLDIRGAGNLLGAEQSGFIADIGFEMYHKILDEALDEMKREEFPELMEEAKDLFTGDCIFETDLDISLPDYYVEGVEERLHLYRELNEIKEEKELSAFSARLKDRFGPLPSDAVALLETLRLRWVGRKLGIEKLVLKNNKLKAVFISDNNSAFYDTDLFTGIISFLNSHPEFGKLREHKDLLSLHIGHIKSVEESISALNLISDHISKKEILN